MKPENRERFKAGERAYLDGWPMTEEQKQAVLARDYNRMLDLGGNVYFLSKLFSTDGLSFSEAVSSMTAMTFDQYKEVARAAIGERVCQDVTITVVAG